MKYEISYIKVDENIDNEEIEGVKMAKELIKEYDPNYSEEEQIVEITIMVFDYFGHIYCPVRGNCKGKSVLDCADFTAEIFDDCEKDFILEYDEKRDLFWARLNNSIGDTLEGKWTGEELNDAIVSIRLVNIR